MVGRDEPPETVAASFALGVAISFTPLIGLHWVIALTLAFLLRLNKVDILLGTLVVNPLTLGPVSAVALPLGRIVLRARQEAIHDLPWGQFYKTSFWTTARPAMKTIGIQWGMGMFSLSIVAGALTYVGMLALLKRRRARQAEATPRTGLADAATGAPATPVQEPAESPDE
jgi:uncharacterized protein (DUF2062 family)